MVQNKTEIEKNKIALEAPFLKNSSLNTSKVQILSRSSLSIVLKRIDSYDISKKLGLLKVLFEKVFYIYRCNILTRRISPTSFVWRI